MWISMWISLEQLTAWGSTWFTRQCPVVKLKREIKREKEKHVSLLDHTSGTQSPLLCLVLRLVETRRLFF